MNHCPAPLPCHREPSDRLFIAGVGSQQLRHLLIKYAKGKDSKGVQWEQLTDWESLMKAAGEGKEQRFPWVLPILRSHAEGKSLCVEEDKRLLRGLAANSSLTGFVRRSRDVICILAKLIGNSEYRVRKDPAALTIFNDGCPALKLNLERREATGQGRGDLQQLLVRLKAMLEKLLPPDDHMVPDRIPISIEEGVALSSPRMLSADVLLFFSRWVLLFLSSLVWCLFIERWMY